MEAGHLSEHDFNLWVQSVLEELNRTIGGNVSEEEDDKVANEILEIGFSIEEIVPALVKYQRNVERDLHYATRFQPAPTVVKKS